jgi:GTPase SAR1 family protein
MKASPSTWYGSVVLDECKRLRKSIVPISEEYYGPIDKLFGHNTLYPFALLLGNHSSGKSSFINYMLGRKTQATGVAPTDDNFTIIAPGEEDFDRNGPALIGDPDLGFCDLKVFGPTLVNHTQLKVRSGISIKNFMIVDSPGMIDSPGTRNQDTAMDRGYDFASVCRWYAERADVILLFFDPDKPGTTGETLSILTNSLVGLDHKLFIILNKADQFYKIHDFARAYGSLCWNLSKVISRKDLPRIYTMCLPSDYVNEENNKRLGNGETNERNLTTPIADTIEYKEPHDLLKSPSLFYKQGFLDLEESR